MPSYENIMAAPADPDKRDRLGKFNEESALGPRFGQGGAPVRLTAVIGE